MEAARVFLRLVEQHHAAERLELDPSTVRLLQQHAGQSGLYVLTQHSIYAATIDSIFKIGRADVLEPRFASYREAQTIVAFYPTPFPRAAEAVAKRLLKACVVHGSETVQAPLALIESVFRHAVGLVNDALVALGHKPTRLIHRAYGRRLRVWILARFGGDAPPNIDSPQNTPLDERDLDGDLRLASKQQRLDCKRQREEDIVDAKRRRLDCKRKREEEDANVKRAQSNAVKRFIAARCVLETYRSDVDWKVRAFTPFDALWKAYQSWQEKSEGEEIVHTSNQFGRLLTPIVGTSEAHRLNTRKEPPDTCVLWSPKCRLNSREKERGRYGLRFKDN